MKADWIWKTIEEAGPKEALWANGEGSSYHELLSGMREWLGKLEHQGIGKGSRVAIIGEYSLETISLFLALLKLDTIIVPLADDDASVIHRRLALVGVEAMIDFRESSKVTLLDQPVEVENPLIDDCLSHDTAGIVIFTSGSTGESKAVLYRADHLINKYQKPTQAEHRTLVFLKFDHIGGINTLLAVLAQSGTMVVSRSRQADEICRQIQEARVTLLPTTPSFLTMLVLSNHSQTYDLSSLRIITYGTEVMPQSTLIAVNQLFPGVKLKQTYGLTELGIMSTKSKSNDSKWVKVGGMGVEWKVVDGIFWVKTDTPMLGYLNAPSPFDSEGWYNTGDRVKFDGDYLEFLGRESEMINVGGEKVYPQEVEDVLLSMPNVVEALVSGVSNPVTGQTIAAELVLEEAEDQKDLRRRIKTFCKDKLARYKIPTQVRVSEKEFIGKRLKKYRIREDLANS